MNSGLFQIWKERQNNYYFCFLLSAGIQEKHLFLKLKMKNFGRVFKHRVCQLQRKNEKD